MKNKLSDSDNVQFIDSVSVPFVDYTGFPRHIVVFDPKLLDILRNDHGWKGCTGEVRVTEGLHRQLLKRLREIKKDE